MRFLNRSAGRLSRHRRRPVAGLLLLLLGLVLTGEPLRRVRALVDGRLGQERRGAGRRRAASCSSSAARPATARTARASPPRTATSSARRWSASAPPRSTSRSAPAGCRRSSRAPRTPRKPLDLHRRGDRGAGGVRRLARPRPGDPRPVRLQPGRPVGGGARGGGLPRWPDLPDQLHRLPQLRRQGRRDAARRLRARPERHRAPSTSTRRMLTGPGQMPTLLQRQPVAGGEARRHRLPLLAARAARSTAASASAAWAR